MYKLKKLIKVLTCFKNPERPTSIDEMLTNSNRSFQNSCAIEMGLSDFHKMIVTILKTYFQKKEPKIIQYRDYKNFSEEEYREFLVNLVWDQDQCPSYDIFLRKCKIALDRRAPLKYKYLRSNHSPFMNKDISKAIMDRTRLRHKFLRSRSVEDRNAYNKQRNYCVSLIRKIKKDYYNNLDYKKIIDNKSFWKYVKPLFTEKNARSNKITLVEDNFILENNDKIAETFNNFFTSVVSNLNIPSFVASSVEIDRIEDPILHVTEQYRNHPSAVAINKKKLNRQFPSSIYQSQT